jgi:hypothetical protein
VNAIILANAAIPVFLFVSPALAVLLPAVILIETAWSGRLLGVGWRQALRPVTIANLASTFLGAVVLAIALSFAGTLFHYTIGAFIGPFDRNPLTELEQFLVAAFWVGPWGKTAQGRTPYCRPLPSGGARCIGRQVRACRPLLFLRIPARRDAAPRFLSFVAVNFARR